MTRFFLGLATLLFVGVAIADSYVRPHVRSDGTYVQGHMRSSPNQYRHDNYSGRGNTNPYTGQRGSQRHEFTNPPAFNTGRSPSANPYQTPNLGNPYGNTNRNPYRNPYLSND